MMSSLTILLPYCKKTNGFHVIVRLFDNRSQKMSKCGNKNGVSNFSRSGFQWCSNSLCLTPTRDLSIIAEVHLQVSQAKGRRSIVIPSKWDASSDSPLKKNDNKKSNHSISKGIDSHLQLTCWQELENKLWVCNVGAANFTSTNLHALFWDTTCNTV